MKAIDIVRYLGATRFREECSKENHPFLRFNGLNLIIYYIDIEYYRRYKTPATDYTEDTLASGKRGPVYKSISDIHNLTLYINDPIVTLGRESSYSDIEISKELAEVINNIYDFFYDDFKETEAFLEKIIRDFMKTKLYKENHSESIYIEDILLEPNNLHLLNLNFLLLAFEAKYNLMLYNS